MYPLDASRNPLQSCLVFHSILDRLQKTFFEQSLTHPMTLFYLYLVKNSTQRNMKRTGEKRVGAQRAKSPSFTEVTKEMNQ